MSLHDDQRALVTGASGFIGGAVARLLSEKGYRVRAFARAASPRHHLRPEYEIAIGDVIDRDSVREAMRGVRFVFHVAADYRLWTSDPAAMLRTNVEGTRIVMEEALQAGVERVVHTSSVATLCAGAGESCDETRRMEPCSTLGPYKRSKILSERVVEEMAERQGLPALIVNPSAPIGAGDLRPTPTGRIVLETVRARVPAFVDTGLNVVHVGDVAKGHLLALTRGVVGERYILGGDNIDLAALLAEVAAQSGRPAPRIRLPVAPLEPLARLNEFIARFTGREPFLNREGLRLSRSPMFFCDAKARRELGYESRPYREAVADAVSWFEAMARNGACAPASLRSKPL